MSKSINQVFLAGNAGKEPDVKTFDGGVKVASFSLATSTGGYEKQDGTDVPEKTQWHNVVAWRGLAKIAEKYIHKGDKVIVLGTIQYREYEKDGVKRYATDILAYDLILCGKAPDNGGSRPPVTAADMPSPSDYPPMLQQTDNLPF